MDRADAIVVGGGPSGVISAITIADAGYRVVILDKKSREKIGNKSCGDALDHIAPDLLKEKFGIEYPSGSELPSPIEYITFASQSLQNKMTANAPGYIVHRLNYGQRLLKVAESKGTEIIGGAKVRDLIWEGDQIVGVKFHKDGELQELKSNVVIDASGYVGTVRKLIRGELKQGVDYSVSNDNTVATYREIVRLDQEHSYKNEILLLYHDSIPIPGYAWIFTDGSKQLNIGVTWPKNIPYPDNKSLKQIYHEVLDPLVDPKTYEVLDSGGGQIPIRPPFDSLVFNGALLVGEAGCMVDPTTAEGHGPSLISGYLAGKAVLDAMKKQSFRKADLWSYNKEVMKYPGSTHAMSYQALQFIKWLGPSGFSFLFRRKIISEEELIEIFQTRDFTLTFWNKILKVLKTLPRVSILLNLRKTIALIEETDKHYREYPDSPDNFIGWLNKRKRLVPFD